MLESQWTSGHGTQGALEPCGRESLGRRAEKAFEGNIVRKN
jgi:hypothetical protein